ncbi:unnamed protein product [Strongylus vulgaris]|uniref:Uncharacterized protein n=1 Tax=Strongylus vulgaris TaxID=40348 RepID=A0A3P7JGY8_STRVU|nr:unnamed protein product [Strongylus vulgaris]
MGIARFYLTTMGEDQNPTTATETPTATASTPLDPDPDTIKMFVGQVRSSFDYILF